MATVVASAALPAPPVHEDASALARKRRREIILSQRGTGSVSSPTVPSPSLTPSTVVDPAIVLPDVATSLMEPDNKRPRTSSTSSVSSSNKKKPQMKYDPEVPMSKEEAALWRREQRRKRNRESAAASRQRQRDRIAELEVEIDGWREKYDAIMSKIQAISADDLIDSLPTLSSPPPLFLNSSAGKDEDDTAVVSDTESEKEHDHKMISRPAQSRIFNPNFYESRCTSTESDEHIDSKESHSCSFCPKQALMLQPQLRSDSVPASFKDVPSNGVSRKNVNGSRSLNISNIIDSKLACRNNNPLPLMITIPAVKITGPPIDSMMLPVSMCPDPCLSNNESDESSSSDGSCNGDAADENEATIPSLLKDEETEFDAFLLDAVQWL